MRRNLLSEPELGSKWFITDEGWSVLDDYRAHGDVGTDPVYVVILSFLADKSSGGATLRAIVERLRVTPQTAQDFLNQMWDRGMVSEGL